MNLIDFGFKLLYTNTPNPIKHDSCATKMKTPYVCMYVCMCVFCLHYIFHYFAQIALREICIQF